MLSWPELETLQQSFHASSAIPLRGNYFLPSLCPSVLYSSLLFASFILYPALLKKREASHHTSDLSSVQLNTANESDKEL